MTQLIDREIRELAKQGMIEPFSEEGRLHGVSHGLTSAGYDLRIGGWSYSVFTLVDVSDLREMGWDAETEASVDNEPHPKDGVIWIEPWQTVRFEVEETLKMPDDIIGYLHGKSTHAMHGFKLIAAPVEPGWQGELKLCFHNACPSPKIVHVGMGIAQITFYRLSGRPERTYMDRRPQHATRT